MVNGNFQKVNRHPHATKAKKTLNAKCNNRSTQARRHPPLREPYMTQILEETKRSDSRKYRMADTVMRAWFYRVSPISAITHVGEIAPPVTRRELLKRENLENGDETAEVTHVEEQAEVDEQIRQEESGGW